MVRGTLARLLAPTNAAAGIEGLAAIPLSLLHGLILVGQSAPLPGSAATAAGRFRNRG